MRQVTRKGLLTVAAASGVLAMSGGMANADSSAQGAAENSPGLLSGNTVQAPVDVPVNVCGNSVNVAGVGNPSTGNGCENGGSSDADRSDNAQERPGGSDAQQGDSAHASGGASDSPGVASGNNVQAPVDVPVNACGNSANVIGIGNPASGNGCDDGSSEQDGSGGDPGAKASGGKSEPGAPEHQGLTPEGGGSEALHAGAVRGASEPVRAEAAPEGGAQLARTGGGAGLPLIAPMGAGLMVGGYVIYRRGRGMRAARTTAQH